MFFYFDLRGFCCRCQEVRPHPDDVCRLRRHSRSPAGCCRKRRRPGSTASRSCWSFWPASCSAGSMDRRSCCRTAGLGRRLAWASRSFDQRGADAAGKPLLRLGYSGDLHRLRRRLHRFFEAAGHRMAELSRRLLLQPSTSRTPSRWLSCRVVADRLPIGILQHPVLFVILCAGALVDRRRDHSRDHHAAPRKSRWRAGLRPDSGRDGGDTHSRTAQAGRFFAAASVS